MNMYRKTKGVGYTGQNYLDVLNGWMDGAFLEESHRAPAETAARHARPIHALYCRRCLHQLVQFRTRHLKVVSVIVTTQR